MQGMQGPPSIADNVAQSVLSCYDSLAKAAKPLIRSNGVPEWTILAGVAVQTKGNPIATNANR
jgi:tRNA-specific adenosine deaminase 1